MIELEDLTKAELIRLVRTKVMFLKDDDITSVKWLSLLDKAREKREESIQMNVATREDFLRSDKLWRRAAAIQLEADNLFARRFPDQQSGGDGAGNLMEVRK